MDVQGGQMSCLMGWDLMEYDYVRVGKGRFIPLSVKPTTSTARLTGDIV
jgi:hypothetical protein